MTSLCTPAAASRGIGSTLLTAASLFVAATSTSAIQPERWTHSTEADFEAGEVENVVVTNLGDLKLASAADPLVELPEGVTVIYDMAVLGEVTLLATGPEGRLLSVRDGEVAELMSFEGRQLFSMLVRPDGERVTLALSGPTSVLQIVEIEDDAASVVREIELPGVRYVWDMVTRNQRRELVLATGTDGKVLSVDLQGNTTELLDTAQANVLCLAEGPDGSVYAGTDTDGLIYRIDSEGTAFVVYDADEPEIGALLVTEDGTVYAGTADAEQAKPGRMENAAEAETGRPDVEIVIEAEAADPSEELPIEPDPQPLDEAEAADPAAGVATESEADTGPAATEPAPAAEADRDDSADAKDPGDVAVETEDAAPSAEQYDAVRDAVRQRLLEARKSGRLGQGRSASATRPTRPAAAPRAAAASRATRSTASTPRASSPRSSATRSWC